MGKLDDERVAAAFCEAELANLRTWMALSGGQKIDFFEEMVELAWHSGALRPERLALRERALTDGDPGSGTRVASNLAEK